VKVLEFIKLIREAEKHVEDGKPYGYRYGQALYNILPVECTDQLTPSKDFFYWRDSRKDEIDSICLHMCEDFKPMEKL
jgi:hypothetical protein